MENQQISGDKSEFQWPKQLSLSREDLSNRKILGFRAAESFIKLSNPIFTFKRTPTGL